MWLVLKDITFNFCLIFPCSNGNSCLLEVVIHANNILLKTCSQDSHNINDEMVRKLKIPVFNVTVYIVSMYFFHPFSFSLSLPLSRNPFLILSGVSIG